MNPLKVRAARDRPTTKGLRLPFGARSSLGVTWQDRYRPSMNTSVTVALPDDEYLLLLGKLAYMVASLEWTLLGDLTSLRRRAPELPEVQALASKSSGRIAKLLGEAAPTVVDDDVRAYYELGSVNLKAAADIRNHALHARPATVDGVQMLYRWTSREDEQFPITKEWLGDSLTQLDRLIRAVNVARPAER